MRYEVVEIVRDVRPDIETDNVEQAVAGALRQSDQRTGERIDFFNRVVVFDRNFVGCRPVECADAIADEVRRVFTENDAFAESNVAILLKRR